MFLYLAAESDAENTSDNGDSTAESPDIATEQPDPTPSAYDIDGEQYTIDQIKEWRQGNMRQSDYTRKSQEVARMRQENQEAIELYEFMRNNPEIVQRLNEEVPDNEVAKSLAVDPRVIELDTKIRTMEIEKALDKVKSEMKDANEIDILQIATDRRITIEDAFQIWKGQNMDKIVKSKASEIVSKTQENAQKTKTLINPNLKPPNGDLGLSAEEIAFAKRIDMPLEEYKKYKNYKR